MCGPAQDKGHGEVQPARLSALILQVPAQASEHGRCFLTPEIPEMGAFSVPPPSSLIEAVVLTLIPFLSTELKLTSFFTKLLCQDVGV